MTSSTIRRAGLDDLTVLQRIYRRASLSNPGDRDMLLAHPDALVWSGAALGEGRTVVAVTGDDQIVGFASIAPAGDAAELADLFVDPDFRRRGVAAQLTQVVLALAGRGGARWLDVVANPHAAAFYAAIGFLPADVQEARFGEAARLRLGIERTRHASDGDGATPTPSAGSEAQDEPLEPVDEWHH